MQEELITPLEGTMVPPDEIIKLQCLQMAVDLRNSNPLDITDPIKMAKEMFNWVKRPLHDDNIIGG